MTDIEKLAYKVLESPKFWLNPDRIKALTELTYWTEVRKVTDLLSNEDFIAKAKKFYESFKYPTKASQTALKNIKDIEEVMGTFSNAVLQVKRKKPWEITREEFYTPVELPLHWSEKGYRMTGEPGSQKIVTLSGEELVPRDPFAAEWVRSRNPTLHEAIVSLALQKGLAVPSRVLADYPHLQAAELESVPDVLYASPARKIKDRLEDLHKRDPKAFYRELDEIKKAIKERERGKIKKLPDISLTDLRDIKKDAEALYR